MKSNQSLLTLHVAKETNRAPSQVLGITCEYCAYCLDEALILRAHYAQERDRKRDEAMSKAKAKLRSVG